MGINETTKNINQLGAVFLAIHRAIINHKLGDSFNFKLFVILFHLFRLLAAAKASGMNSRIERIGRLSILWDERLGSGRFGSVFPGKCKDVQEGVAVKRMEKKKINIDTSLYLKAKRHPNIIGYYETETMDDELV